MASEEPSSEAKLKGQAQEPRDGDLLDKRGRAKNSLQLPLLGKVLDIPSGGVAMVVAMVVGGRPAVKDALLIRISFVLGHICHLSSV